MEGVAAALEEVAALTALVSVVMPGMLAETAARSVGKPLPRGTPTPLPLATLEPLRALIAIEDLMSLMEISDRACLPLCLVVCLASLLLLLLQDS